MPHSVNNVTSITLQAMHLKAMTRKLSESRIWTKCQPEWHVTSPVFINRTAMRANDPEIQHGGDSEIRDPIV